jgi:putative nucleotidyltransferase with HDIG domain
VYKAWKRLSSQLLVLLDTNACYIKGIREKANPPQGGGAKPRASIARGSRAAEKGAVVMVDHARPGGGQVHAAGELSELAQVASEGAPETVERVLVAAKEQLGMEAAFVSEFSEQRMMYRKLVGEAESFGLREGESIPLEDTFCRLLIEGVLPNLISDAKNDERVKVLDATGKADIGSYAGVPIEFSDGRLYGTLCALSHSPNPSLQERDVKFMRVLARIVAEQLEREEREQEKQRLALEAAGLQALLAAVEARDGYTGEHSKTVVELAVEVARTLGLPEDEIRIVRVASLLHDVGKVAIPDSILNKPGTLDEEERKAMEHHVEVGSRMVSEVKGLAHLAPIIGATHERWDGRGYPDGLEGEEIPLASRIVHACDAWHAMGSDRPYRAALSVERTIGELKENMGKQFEARVVLALIEVLKTRQLVPPEEEPMIGDAF